MRVGSHSSGIAGRQLSELCLKATLLVEKFLRPITLQPLFQELKVAWRTGWRDGERHLMRTEGAFIGNSIDLFWPGPAFWRSENDHRPLGLRPAVLGTSTFLDPTNISNHSVQNSRHGLMHGFWFVPLDEIWFPTVTLK